MSLYPVLPWLCHVRQKRQVRDRPHEFDLTARKAHLLSIAVYCTLPMCKQGIKGKTCLSSYCRHFHRFCNYANRMSATNILAGAVAPLKHGSRRIIVKIDGKIDQVFKSWGTLARPDV